MKSGGVRRPRDRRGPCGGHLEFEAVGVPRHDGGGGLPEGRVPVAPLRQAPGHLGQLLGRRRAPRGGAEEAKRAERKYM